MQHTRHLMQNRKRKSNLPRGATDNDVEYWKQRALAAEELLQPIIDSSTSYRQTTKEKVRLDMTKLIHRFVNDGDWTVLSQEYSINGTLQRLLAAISSNSYDSSRYAAKMGYDLSSYADAIEWRTIMKRSYLLGVIARQKSSHHIPMEHVLAGMVAVRCGMHKKLWALFSGYLSVLPSKIFINELIDHLMSKPFALPKRGRIGLAAYDNCGYTRKFQYERVGQHTNTRINTANSVDIPIGPECEGIHDETAIWRATRQDLLHLFRPNHFATRLHVEDIGKRAWHYMAVDEDERVKIWDYPRDVPQQEGILMFARH